MLCATIIIYSLAMPPQPLSPLHHQVTALPHPPRSLNGSIVGFQGNYNIHDTQVIMKYIELIIHTPISFGVSKIEMFVKVAYKKKNYVLLCCILYENK